MTEVEAVREEEGWVLGKVWEEQLWVVGEMEVVEERASFGDGSLGGRFAFSSSSVIRERKSLPCLMGHQNLLNISDRPDSPRGKDH